MTEELKRIENIVIEGLEEGADNRKWSIEHCGLAETIKDLMRMHKHDIALLNSLFYQVTEIKDSCKSEHWLMEETRNAIDQGKKYRELCMTIADALYDVSKPIAGGCAQSLHEKRHYDRLNEFYWKIKNWMKEHDSNRIK
jgi:hypothetical protein